MRKVLNLLIVFILSSSSLSYAQNLEGYFKIAAENNPGLQAKYAAFEASLQKVQQVNTLPEPNFSFGYFISPVETRVGPQRAKFSLSQMFPWFGTLKAQSDAAALTAEAKYQSFRDARNKVYFQVAAAYYPLYELQKWVNVEKKNIEILKSYKSIATNKFENGQGPMVDVLRVDIMLKESQTNLGILDEKKKPLLATFNNLLKRNQEEPVSISDSLLIEPLAFEYRKDSLLTDNPALVELDLKLKASKASEIAADKEGLPKIGVGLDYVLVGDRSDISAAMPVPEDNGKDALMPMVSVSIPIFRSKYKAAVKEAQLLQKSYTLQKEEYANSLSSNYEMTWFELSKHRKLLDLYVAQIQETRQMLTLLLSAYGNSGKEFEEILRMQQQLLKYEKMKATAEIQYQLALARLNYLTAKKYDHERK